MEQKVQLVKLDHVREEGERRVKFAAIQHIADYLNTSKYKLPGPKGYLSPSTIQKWTTTCPHALYITQILKEVKSYRSLPLIFGSAQHEAMAYAFEEYKSSGEVNLSRVLGVFHQYIQDELSKTEPLFKEYVKWEKLQTKSEEEFQADFDKSIQKRTEDAVATLTQYFELDTHKKLCTPDEIERIEEDAFAVVCGIPVYFVADLVLKDKVIDWKFTTNSAVSQRFSKVPADIQLWIYEMAYGKTGELHLLTPPLKRLPKDGKPRPPATVFTRRDPGQRLISSSDFIEMIEAIPRAIEKGYFEKRGVSYGGGCGDCECFEVCTQDSEIVGDITSEIEALVLHKQGSQFTGLTPESIRAKIDQDQDKDRDLSCELAFHGEE